MSKKNNNNKRKPSNIKNTIIISIVAAVIIGLIATVALYKGNQSAKAEELYQKDNVHSATVNLLDDPNYQNIILPKELEEKIDNQEELFVYFFSPLCKYCEESKDDITRVFKEMDIEHYQLNLLEYEEGYQKYGVRGTPAIFHYKDGAIVDHIYGSQPYKSYLEWIKKQNKEE